MNKKIYSLDENSEKLNMKDLTLINSKLKIPLKNHQNTIIKTMIELENTGEINLELESKIIRNDIILKEEVINNETYFNLYYNERENNIQFSNIKYTIQMNYGILADKVGSGKTFEIIGLICHTQIPKQHPKIFSSGYYTSIKYIDDEECIPTNIIIVPHNLVLQWKKVLEYTKLNYYMINKKSHIDNLTSVYNIFEGENSPEILPNSCIVNYDVILISATMLEVFYNKFPDIKWARLIIDEVNSINKLPVNFTIKANFIWYITATPSGIRWIRRNYIRDMIVGINKSLFSKIIIKNEDSYVTNSMALPPLNQIIINCDTPIGIRMITDFVSSDIINMLHAGNIKDAIFKLNCNVDTDDNIINVIKNKLEKDIHNRKLELEYMERMIHSDRRNHDESIKKLKEKIISLENRLKNITDRIKTLEKDSCPICIDEIKTPALIPCCNNIFCLECLAIIHNKKCPMCRNPFTMKDLHIINNNITKTLKNKKLLSKKDNLINIIKKKVNGKFLVFSNYDNTNDNIAKILTDENISYSKLCGNINVINNTIEKFKNGIIKVLLLNASNYGSGLNLQMASDIIIYHEMCTELQTQIIGRSQRMGRIEPLNVYFLVHENEQVNCTNPNLNLNIFDDFENNDLDKILNYDNSNIEEEINIIN